MANLVEDTYKEIYDSINVGIAILDKDTGKILEANGFFCNLFGISPEEVKDLTIGHLSSGVFPYTLEKAMGLISQASAGEPQLSEWHAKDKSGRLFWVEMTFKSIFIPEPRVLVIVRDVSEHKRIDEALYESEGRLSAIIDGSPIPQFVIGKDHKVLYWNKALEKYSGIKAEDIIGTDRQWMAFYGEERPCMADFLVDGKEDELHKWYDGKFMKSRLLEGAFEAVDFFPNLGESGIWLYFTAKAIRDPMGNIIGAVETLEDITERKRAEEALRGSEEKFRVLDTERRRIEDALRESEEKFRVLAETSPAAIILYQGDRLVFINSMTEKMTGYTKDELLQRKFWDWVHPDHREMVKVRGLARQRGEPVPTTYEFKYVQKSGEEGWALISAGALEYHGKPAGIATIFDVTEYKRVEEALRESEKQFRQLVENSPIAILVISGMGQKTMMINNKFTELFGYALEDVPDTGRWLHLVHPDEKSMKKLKTDWATAVEGAIDLRREIEHIEAQVICKDGSIRYIEFFLSPIGGRYLATFVDITERRRIDEALRKSERRLSAIIDGSPIPQFVIDKDHKVLYWNKALEKYSGIKAEDVIGTDRQWMAFYNDERPCMADFLVDGKESEIPKWYPGKYKESRLIEGAYEATDFFPALGEKGIWLYFTAKAIRDPAGNIIGAVETLEDITERKLAEEALAEAKAQVELYLDLMGHDINNINQIGIGYLEMALSTLELDEEGRQLIFRPLEALQSGSRLIDNVRKLQRAREGGFMLYEIDTGKVLLDLIPVYLNIPGREVTINFVYHKCHVMANDLLPDVFSNIIGNAVKHSSGPVVIDIDLSKTRVDGKMYCRISIEDNGPGISDALKSVLFTRYKRGGMKPSGRGFGLYLVKSLVDDFHGKVWVEDRVPGDYTKGTRFVVMLPAIAD